MTVNLFDTLDFRQPGLTDLETVYAICQGGFSSDELKRHYATPNFTWRELFVHRSSKELRGVTMEHLANLQRLAWKLEGVREQFGKPVTITSGWRDKATNKRIGGARESRHMTGEAADIVVVNTSPVIVQRRLEPYWDGGMGYGSTFTHLDDRGWKARFGY
jgi:uncharacterized protein YcbK (DUF882 family)